ncbi:LOW QUALITY PROTEIN: putative tubulin polyglutamylase TTLL9 [Morus bassanus]
MGCENCFVLASPVHAGIQKTKIEPSPPQNKNSTQCCQKNYLVKNLKRFRKQLEAGKLEATKCAFILKTFKMLRVLFVDEFRKNLGIAWILKPVSMSQGEGIFLFRKLKDVIVAPFLFSQYIPLKAWLYGGGFACFSNTFTLNSRDVHYVHLTNVAVQETAPEYDPGKGCEWLIQQFGQHSTARRGAGSVDVLFADTDNAFIPSIRSVQKVIISDKHCFELYAYDILIHQDLKPWLLEVNASPSLTASSQEECELKCHLLKDTLHVVDREGRLMGKKCVGGFDLIWNDGPVSRGGDLAALVNENIMANTDLGCYHDSKKQLKQFFRNLPAQQKG